MIEPHQNKFHQKLKLWLIYGISGFLIPSFLLPIGVWAISQKPGEFLIARPEDDPTLRKNIDGIKLPESQTNVRVEGRIKPPDITPKKPANTDTSSGSKPSTERTGGSKPSNNESDDSQPSTPRTGSRTPRTPRTGSRKPSTPRNDSSQASTPRNGSRSSNDYSSKEPTFKEIDFVDIPFGILAPGDFQFENRYFHFYRFDGKENQVIQLRLVGSADRRRTNNLSLQPYMFLLDPESKVILQRGSSGDSNKVNDAFVYTKLPTTGTYTIAITSQKPKDKGRYTLALRNDRASYIEDQSTAITTNSPTLPKGNAYDINEFKGKKGQLVSVRVDSVFEEFSPFIVLLNAKGEVVSLDNRQEGRYSALIDRAKLPDDGTYYIVTISRNPQERGRYRLTIF